MGKLTKEQFEKEVLEALEAQEAGNKEIMQQTQSLELLKRLKATTKLGSTKLPKLE